MEYLHVLSRPKVIDQEHDVVWTEAYIDSTVSLHDKAFNIGLLHIMMNREQNCCGRNTSCASDFFCWNVPIQCKNQHFISLCYK